MSDIQNHIFVFPNFVLDPGRVLQGDDQRIPTAKLWFFLLPPISDMG